MAVNTPAPSALVSFQRDVSSPVGAGSSRPSEGKMWPRGIK
jgi:hypothetical protein